MELLREMLELLLVEFLDLIQVLLKHSPKYFIGGHRVDLNLEVYLVARDGCARTKLSADRRASSSGETNIKDDMNRKI